MFKLLILTDAKEICPNCGNEVNESYDYCPRCGAKIKVSQSALKEQIEETRHNERGCHNSFIAGVIIMAIGAIIGIIPTATRRSGDYIITYHPYADVATVILILGGILVMIGTGFGIYYVRRRNRLLRQYEKQEKYDKGAESIGPRP